MTPAMLDFDDIGGWEAGLTAVLRDSVSSTLAEKLRAARPQYVEDARDVLFSLATRDQLIDRTLQWLQASSVVGYHGSRLTGEEAAAIRIQGLRPLASNERRTRLVRALSKHPSWPTVGPSLDAAIDAHSKGAAAGRREGQVHLTLSRAGLTHGFSHYLTHGSEFDQHVASSLLGHTGKDLLKGDGTPCLIRVVVPGAAALAAAHPHFTVEDTRRRGDIPNLVKEFLNAWSFRLANPAFAPASLKLDCGMRFLAPVPAAWIVGVELMPELDGRDDA